MRVIIIGAGPAGLSLAHALLKAGIDDFVVLERRSNPVDHRGAGLGLWPHTVRILDQLGLLEGARKIVPTLKNSVHLDPMGNLLSESNLFDIIAENHGHQFMLFERTRLIRLLYESVPNKEKHVIPGKQVTRIDQDEKGATVSCADGSQYAGDIVVGCDGVRSIVRQLGVAAQPPSALRSPETLFTSKFRCLFGVSKLVDGLGPCQMVETHDEGVMFQIMCTEDQAYFLIYESKGREESGLRTYTDQDCCLMAEKYASHSVGKGGKAIFQHLWDTRVRADLFDLEEGVVSKWHNGRIVLIGDAVHKMTANLAFGANCALEDAASLTNGLHSLLGHTSSPSTSELEAVFSAYQNERKGRANFCVQFTGMYTRVATWQNDLFKFANVYLAPAIGDKLVADWVFALIPKNGVKLNFVEEKDVLVGKVPYLH